MKMPRLSAGDVANLIWGQPDPQLLFEWSDSAYVAQFIEELKTAIPFGQSGAHKGPNMKASYSLVASIFSKVTATNDT
jgi:hypothetical protein